MQTAVVLIVFNRPAETERVFGEIARARPPKLFVVADGPRLDRPGEAEKCAACRKVVDRVDWPCEVNVNFADVNMGCGHRPYTGIRWAFEQVEEAIILEDDCLPDPTFFAFCEELLERYRHDERVMHISGDNFHFGRQQLDFSYSFSCYSLTWGWATWRRAFRSYDRQIKLWPLLRDTLWLQDVLGDPTAIEYWTEIFDKAHGEGDRATYWAYQWLFTMWAQRGLAILPNTNLISNIGYGEDATHTHTSGDPRSNLSTGAIEFPLRHPDFVLRDRQVDRATFEQVVRRRPRGMYSRIRKAVVDALPVDTRRALASARARMMLSK
jgi:hypothetical protein